MRRLSLFLLMLLLALPSTAQDALNLPTELYVLLNDGIVQRYGLGAEGVSNVTPEGQFVVDFGVSPDGGYIAYRTADALVVAEVLTGDGEALLVNPPLPPSRGQGATVAWSPDGSALAYTTETGLRVYFRPGVTDATTADITDGFSGSGFSALLWSPDGRYLAARSIVEDIWQVYAVGVGTVGLSAVVAPAADVAWLPDGRLGFAPLDGGLVGLNVNVANAQGDILPPSRRYDALATRADGTVVAFSRPTASDAGNVGRLTVIDPVAGTSEVVGTADVPLDGLRWTPGATLAVAFRGGVLVLIDPTSGGGFQLPVSSAVAYDWGAPPLPTVDGYPVPANLFFIAPDDTVTQQVWQLFRDGSLPVPLTISDEDVRGYTISPDGFNVAYATDEALWLQRLNDGSPPDLLAPREVAGPVRMDFSADGTTIAYVGPDGIRTVPTTGGEPSLLIANTLDEGNTADGRAFTEPRYAANFGAMLLDVVYAEGSATGVLDLNSGELLELPYGYANGRWTYNGDILTFGALSPFTEAGVQRSTANSVDEPTVVLPVDVPVQDAVLVPGRTWEDFRLVLASSGDTGPTPLQVYNYRDGAGLEPVYAGGFMAAPRLSPDGTMVAGYTRIAPDGASGVARGRLTLLNIATGEQVALAAPSTVTDIKWQR